MAGWLDEGLRSEIKGGGGSRRKVKTSAGISRLEGSAGWPEAMRGSGNGRPAGEEDESDSPGPLDRETRRRRPAWKARTKRKNVLPQLRHRHAG
jgi:hypothetical protein